MKLPIPKYIEDIEKMSKEHMNDEVICSWINECSNYGIHCYHCRFNANLGIKNYFKLDDDKKTLHYLEK
jgi:hypothetical protein